jgi:hypothetical protein
MPLLSKVLMVILAIAIGWIRFCFRDMIIKQIRLCLSMYILYRKAGAGDAVGGRPLPHTFFDEALCMNIGIPRVVGVSLEVIIAI